MLARTTLFSTVAFLLLTAPAVAQSIPVTNYGFASPYVAPFPPYAVAGISNWEQSPMPAYWTADGNNAQGWTDTVGVFVNVPSDWIDNLVPSGGTGTHQQAAFVFADPGLEISQQLTNTFQVGASYQLTVGIEGGGYGMAIGCPMEIGLYYLDGNGNQVMVGTTTVLNDNPSTIISHLPDRVLTIPAVPAGAAWAGQPIGVAMLQTSTTDNEGGYWDIDNVRLVASITSSAVWTGAAVGSTNWSNSANWGGVAPASGASLTFANPVSGQTANSNDFAVGTNFAGITFASSAPTFNLQGNAIQLSGSVVNQSSVSQTIGLGLQLITGGGTMDTGTGTMAITGAISGSSSLTEIGSGSLILSGSNTYNGGTSVLAGMLEINGASALPTGGSLTIGEAGQFGSNAVFSTATPAASPAPEPGTLLLLAVSAAAIVVGLMRGRRKVALCARKYI